MKKEKTTKLSNIKECEFKNTITKSDLVSMWVSEIENALKSEISDLLEEARIVGLDKEKALSASKKLIKKSFEKTLCKLAAAEKLLSGVFKNKKIVSFKSYSADIDENEIRLFVRMGAECTLGETEISISPGRIESAIKMKMPKKTISAHLRAEALGEKHGEINGRIYDLRSHLHDSLGREKRVKDEITRNSIKTTQKGKEVVDTLEKLKTDILKGMGIAQQKGD